MKKLLAVLILMAAFAVVVGGFVYLNVAFDFNMGMPSSAGTGTVFTTILDFIGMVGVGGCLLYLIPAGVIWALATLDG